MPSDPVANQQNQHSPVPRRAAFRKWVDASGRYSVEAQFVEIKGDRVDLRKTNGTTVAVPLQRLGEQDRSYIESREKTDASSDTPAQHAKAKEDFDSKRHSSVNHLQSACYQSDYSNRNEDEDPREERRKQVQRETLKNIYMASLVKSAQR